MMSVQSNPVYSNYCSTFCPFRGQEFDLKLAQKVSRMMMNIRGLIMDDPEHTIHLSTLEFATRTNPGSEIEMAEIE